MKISQTKMSMSRLGTKESALIGEPNHMVHLKEPEFPSLAQTQLICPNIPDCLPCD